MADQGIRIPSILRRESAVKITHTLIASLIITSVAFSATIYVPDDYPTIQAAINAAVNDDAIIVRPGTYLENIDFLGKAVWLKSEQGPEVTIIDGNQARSVVTLKRGEPRTAVLEGFRITNGHTWSYHLVGGGIHIKDSSPTIIKNIVYQNTAQRGGAGIQCLDSGPVIDGNVIVNNYNLHIGGGISVYGNGTSETIITNNTIARNDGFEANGIELFRSDSNTIISNNVIAQNTGEQSSSGISCCNSHPVISFNIITENQGRGILCDAYSQESSSPEITANIISKNGRGGIYCESTGHPPINYNIISGNVGYKGGGIYLGSNCTTDIKNNVICRNEATESGGGIQINTDWDTTTKLYNNTVFGNRAPVGGGLCADGKINWSSAGNNVVIANCIFWQNHANNGKEIRVQNYCDLTSDFSDIDGNYSSVTFGWGCTFSGGTGIIDAAPLFVDPANDDFHLTWTSPCRDAGDATLPGITSVDNEGDPRIAFGNIDMGADEFYYHLYHTGRAIPGSSIDMKVVGYPGAPVTLALGSGIQDPPQSTRHGDLWLTWPPLWRSSTGTIPGCGVLVRPMTVPSTWTPGEEHPLQALVGPWGSTPTRLTNLKVLRVW